MMNKLRLLLVAAAILTLLLPVTRAFAVTSSGFTQMGDGDWYDSFKIDRNYYAGPHGYLPNMAYETLGAYADQAFNLGVQFSQAYPDTLQRAQAVLRYVQTWVQYGYDSDNVVRDGVAQGEWAWNADETASHIDTAAGTCAIGDCEDMAFFLATVYTGAVIDAAVVDAPDHVGCLIWLPDFANANHYWSLDDGRGKGWIWVEATGSDNPLGWTPPDFFDGNWQAYAITAAGSVTGEAVPLTPQTQVPIGQIPAEPLLVGAVAVVVLVALAAVGLRRRRSRPDYTYLPPPPPGWSG